MGGVGDMFHRAQVTQRFYIFKDTGQRELRRDAFHVQKICYVKKELGATHILVGI